MDNRDLRAVGFGTVQAVSGGVAIEADGLRKRYGDVVALDEVDLRAEAGSILGLLGPNGAGKTTAVRILTTLLLPDGGSARVAGLDVVRDAAKLRERIGLAGQYAAVDENLTGFENLEMFGRLYHLGRPASRARARELLAAGALVARPPVIFLDEPTTGLDLPSRLSLWDAIEALVADGTTVLLTTQYLDEADYLAHEIAVIDQGRLIAEGTPDKLKAEVGGDRLEVRLEDPSQCEPALAVLRPLADGSASLDDGVLRVPLRERRGAIAQAVRQLDAAAIGIDDLAIRRPTLDDVFLKLTGHVAEEEGPE